MFTFQAVLMLHGGEDYRFVIVEDFGIVSSYAPRTIAGDIQIMVYVSHLRWHTKSLHMYV